MRSELLFRAAFILYCAEAGIFLLVAPWTPAWDRISGLMGGGLLSSLFLASWVRSLCSAFGSLHLVWLLHDLDLFLRDRPHRAPDTASTPGH